MGPTSSSSLAGRRVFITGAARGIGAALAKRLHAKGARIALAGLEEDLLEDVARSCDAHWTRCDVADRHDVDEAVEQAVGALGGLDIVIANAGVAAQLPLIGGDPSIFERTVQVNLLGAYYTLRAAGPHISHQTGYALVMSSLGGAVHVPLMGAYSASKAGVEALGNTFRSEIHQSAARVGVAYFAELDTDMTSRGFGTEAAKSFLGNRPLTRITPLEVGIDALERGIARRSRRIVAPAWVELVLPIRMLAQPVVDRFTQRRIVGALEIARTETVDLTTLQPGS